MNRKLSTELFNNHLNDMLSNPELVNKGITLVHQEQDFAVISIPVKRKNKNLYLRIQNINFDIEPLYVYFVNPVDYKQLPPNLYPSGLGIAGGHDMLTNPIICISSTYSFHTHPVHRITPFDMFRNSFQLSNLIKRIENHINTNWNIPDGGCY